MPVHPQGERRWALPAAGGSTSLTRLWRTVGPGALAPDLAKPLLAAATAALQGSGPSVAASEWEDAPAALRDARAVLGRCGPAHPDVDVVATAALALALRGEKAAATFLADALDRLAADGTGGPHHARFAYAWRSRVELKPAGVSAGSDDGAPDRLRLPGDDTEGEPMRLWIFSDLHIDIGSPWTPASIPGADLAVVAGDVGEGLVKSIAWLAATVRPHMPVAFVAGNHEFYRRCLPDELQAGRAAAMEAGIYLLENDTVRFGDVLVSGCTLWTDYELDGPATRVPAMRDARVGLNDHRLIAWSRKPEWRRFRPEEALALHLASRRFLETALRSAADATTRAHVVVTHHAPAAGSVAPRFLGKPLNAAYASRLDDLIEAGRPSLWVHGHTHTPFDYRLGGTRVLCNPRGYPGENPRFQPGLVVEV